MSMWEGIEPQDLPPVVKNRIAQLSEARDLARAERDQALTRCKELEARLERALDSNWRLGRVDLPRVANERDKAMLERDELKREVEHWKARAAMACQCAPDNCDCNGCLLAAERNRGG